MTLSTRGNFPPKTGHPIRSYQVINELSLKEGRVVVSKDTDFYYSHLLPRKPWKLLLVRTGNMSTRDLKRLFETHLPAIIHLLEANARVELRRQSVQVVA